MIFSMALRYFQVPKDGKNLNDQVSYEVWRRLLLLGNTPRKAQKSLRSTPLTGGYVAILRSNVKRPHAIFSIRRCESERPVDTVGRRHDDRLRESHLRHF